MKIKLISVLVLFVLITASCTKTIEFDKERDYIEEKGDIIYYKGTPYSGEIVRYFDDGQLDKKTSHKDGKPHGVWE